MTVRPAQVALLVIELADARTTIECQDEEIQTLRARVASLEAICHRLQQEAAVARQPVTVGDVPSTMSIRERDQGSPTPAKESSPSAHHNTAIASGTQGADGLLRTPAAPLLPSPPSLNTSLVNWSACDSSSLSHPARGPEGTQHVFSSRENTSNFRSIVTFPSECERNRRSRNDSAAVQDSAAVSSSRCNPKSVADLQLLLRTSQRRPL